MSLEAMEKVLEIEEKCRERKAAAEAQVRQMVEDAEKSGLAGLQQMRLDAVEGGKQLLRKAEQRAAVQTEEIGRAAEEESAALKKAAEAHLEEAAEFIVGRVVKQ